MDKYTYSQVFEASTNYFNGDELAAKVFVDKYALQNLDGEYLELTPKDMHWRLAKEFARIEQKYPNPMSEQEIFDLLDNFKYIVPQGSPMFGIGNDYYTQSLGNCFAAGTKVFTTNRGPVSIEDIIPGDFTVTHLGRVKEIKQTHKNLLGERDLFKIKCFRTPEFSVTGNHKLFSISQEQLNWGIKPQFNSVEYLRVGDFIQVPNNEDSGQVSDIDINSLFQEEYSYGNRNYRVLRTENHIKLETIFSKSKKTHAHWIPKSIKVDTDFAYFLGLWYGDGCIFGENSSETAGRRNRASKVRTAVKGITFTFGSHENNLIEFVSNYLNKLNITVDINYNKDRDGTTQIVVHSPLFGYVFETLFGSRFDGKKLHESIYSWPKNLTEALSQGLLDSDGTVTKNGDCRVVLNNKPLICSFYHLLRSRGIFVGFSQTHKTARLDFGRNDKFRNNSLKNYSDDRLLQSLSNKTLQSIIIDGKTFTQIVSKEQSNERPMYVYTLGVEDDHSYAVEGLVSLNCFVIGSPFDSYGGILKSDQELVQLMKRRAGVGIDISNIRPKGAGTQNAAKTTDGIGVFMERFSNSCREVAQSGRRGALMESISINHPDIETFINIKKDKTKVTGANISIRISDEFMTAVKDDKPFTLKWPVDSSAPTITKTIKAKDLWNQIINSAWTCAEPGILYWDKIISGSPADIYAEKYPNFKTQSTNPCGELPLGLDSCRLLVLNLLSFIKDPFTNKAIFDYNLFSIIAQKAQRLMDDLIDLEIEKITKIIEKIKNDPEPEEVKNIELKLWEQFLESCSSGRRTGTGITALGDTLAALNIKYGSKESIKISEEIYKQLMINCYKSSSIMASERGAFAIYDPFLEKSHKFLTFCLSQDKELEFLHKKHGRRNIALLTTAPTGSVSTLTQTSSGIEPVFMLSYTRRKKINPSDKNAKVDFVDAMGDSWQEFTVYHHGVKHWMEATGETDITKSPYWRATANEIDWVASVDLQAAAQKYIDHSISKTCNLPEDVSKELVSEIYMKAWESGCKGFTIYRDKCRDGVLINKNEITNKIISDRPTNIEAVMAPKRPGELDCEIKKVKISGATWTIFVGMLKGKPYEIFGGLSKYVDIPNKYKLGKIVKNGKNNGVTTYNLIVGEGDDQMIIKDIANVFENANFGALTRIISLALRHGIAAQFIAEQFLKDKDSEITSFSKVIARVLKSYITDGTKSSLERKCPGCGKENSFIYQENCLKCTNCTYTKC